MVPGMSVAQREGKKSGLTQRIQASFQSMVRIQVGRERDSKELKKWMFP